MSASWISALGWTATAVFVGSYFFSRPSFLRGAQMGGAVLWITYGLLIGASPVIVANKLVTLGAPPARRMGRARRARRRDHSSSPSGSGTFELTSLAMVDGSAPAIGYVRVQSTEPFLVSATVTVSAAPAGLLSTAPYTT